MGKLILSFLLAAVIIAAVGFTVALNQSITSQPDNNLKTFTSQKELENFIAEGIEKAEKERFVDALPAVTSAPAPAAGEADAYAVNAPAYSGTNIQVAGVDEADIVKTDGQFIYLASNNRFIIVEAYPQSEMKVVSDTPVEGRILGLFINRDRLVVFEESYYSYIKPMPEPQSQIIIEPPTPISYGIYLKVYDIVDRKNPQQVRDIFLNGSYVSSRMIGDWVYAVVSQPTVYWVQDKPEIVLPTICVDEDVRDVPPTEVHYSDSSDIPVNYTLIIALNVQSDDKEPEYKIILTGYATTLYVSQRNIYVAMPKGDWWSGDGSTIIHRISTDGQNITPEATGEVPGRVLNQFSMDEYKGYFRIATTTPSFGQSQTSANHVYVLNADLNIVGRLEGLAPGEDIYSARFIGDRCYLVTFKKIDPLFTIDLSSPEEPKVLGKLKIPGYSDYLHPYDENYLIGIGKETVEAKEGDFAWYQGLKISLFDVSDIENPTEAAKLIIGDRGTESSVLSDHHAMLFDKNRNLLVIPVLEAKIFPEKYPQEMDPSMYGEYVFQGAYVLNISPEDGISIKGKITHVEDPQIYLKSGYYIDSTYEIRRSLYIADVLYTISDGKIMANSLTDLSEISKVNLLM